MNKIHEGISLDTAIGPVIVTVDEACRLLGVHRRTAQRWARGQRSPSRAHAALLAILSGQVVPFPGWELYSFQTRKGPAPTGRAFSVLVDPSGRSFLPDDLTRPV